MSEAGFVVQSVAGMSAYLYSTNYDPGRFRQELDRMVEHVRGGREAPPARTGRAGRTATARPRGREEPEEEAAEAPEDRSARAPARSRRPAPVQTGSRGKEEARNAPAGQRTRREPARPGRKKAA